MPTRHLRNRRVVYLRLATTPNALVIPTRSRAQLGRTENAQRARDLSSCEDFDCLVNGFRQGTASARAVKHCDSVRLLPLRE
jgi:hypothetical protein